MSLSTTHSNDSLRRIADSLISSGQSTEWKGHDKHDGLNSKLVWACFGWSKATRLLALQAIMRFPIDIRGILRVQPVENPKGLALFTQAFLSLWSTYQSEFYLSSAKALGERLLLLRAPLGEGSGLAWGYQYPWQDLGFFAPKGLPNAVVSSFVGEAMLDLYDATEDNRFRDAALESLPFYINALPRLVETDEELCLAYMPVRMSMRVLDVSALVGSFLARCTNYNDDSDISDYATRMVRYVVNRQTEVGAWWYTDPPHASPVRIDNYHTGFILDAIWRYMHRTGDRSLADAYQRGLEFYAGNLFEANGAPKWMSDQAYPRDVHGSAQGIITFSRHSNEFPGLAEKILSWAVDNLYDGKGRFWYRRYRRRTDRRFFLRWNNGWMVRAISDLLRERAAITKGTMPNQTNPGRRSADA